ncbi:transposase [Streptomyces olivaceus]
MLRAATGPPRVEDRQVINGMVYKIRTGISWRNLLERFEPWKTIYARFHHCGLNGVFTQALQQIQAHADTAGDIHCWSRSTPPSSEPISTPPPSAEIGGGINRMNRLITPSADPEAG